MADLRFISFAAALIAAPAFADVDGAVADAIAAVDAVPPQAMFAAQTLEQTDGCTLTVTLIEGPPDYAESALASITADMATLNFEDAQRAPVPTDGFEGVMLLIPTSDMQPTVSEAVIVAGADQETQEAFVATGGSCDGADCTSVSPTPFFRIAIMNADAQTGTDTVLAALTQVGAQCATSGQ